VEVSYYPRITMRHTLLTLFLACVALATIAQNERRIIDVTGSAELEITPNIIVVSVTLKEYDDNKVKISIEKIDDDFSQAAKVSNIPFDKITISDLRVSSLEERKRGRNIYAQKTYEITFARTEDVVAFLANLKNVKADYVSIIKTSHSELERYRLELKTEALKAAKRKAEILLGSIGSKLGNVTHVTELASFRPELYSSNSLILDNNVSFQDASSLDGSVDHVSIKKIKLRFEMSASFEIE
jgi:uncharacterized protein YggE